MRVPVLLLLLLLMLGVFVLPGWGVSDESSALNHVLAGYDPRTLPRVNGGPVTVNIGLALRRIVNVDQKTQVLTLSVWMRQSWVDARLAWNTSLYNVSTLYIPHSHHWKPDVILYNSAKQDVGAMFDSVITPVTPDGHVMYMFPAIFHTTCPLDIYHFPMDEQNCELKFGSWAYGGDSLVLETREPNSADLSNFVSGGEWQMTSFRAEMHRKPYGCCVDPFYDVTFYMKIRRTYAMLFYYLFVPTIFLNLLATMQFVLPCDSDEKVTFGVTMFLAMVVYLLLLNETLPMAETVPVIIRYMGSTIILDGLSLISTIIVLNIHHNGNHDNQLSLPRWARVFFLHWLAWTLCMRRCITSDVEHGDKLTTYHSSPVLVPEEKEDDNQEDEVVSQASVENVSECPTPVNYSKSRVVPQAQQPVLRDLGQLNARSISRDTLTGSRRNLTIRASALSDHRSAMMYKLVKATEDHMERVTELDKEREVSCEWQQVAMVIDRLMLIVYSVVMVFLFSWVYVHLPGYDE